MNTPRLSAIALTLIAVGAAVALLSALMRRAARRDERADILAQSQDMVSEGGPAEA
jgi:hypothetical protein